MRRMNAREMIDELLTLGVFKLNTRDWDFLSPTNDRHEMPIIISQILLERIITKRAEPAAQGPSPLQLFLAALDTVHANADSGLAGIILESAQDRVTLQREIDRLCQGSITFQSLSDQELAQTPTLAHLQLSPMTESVAKFRTRLQDLYRSGQFSMDGACATDHALLPPECVSDSNLYIPVSLLLLEGREANDYMDDQMPSRLGGSGTVADSQTIPLEYIFSGGRGGVRRSRCLLVGPPGAGKTMTSLEVLRQWARCTMFTECYLALYIPARALCEDVENVWDLLRLASPCYGLSGDQMKEVQQYILDHSKQLLLVVDGLDEVPERLLSSTSMFSMLLHGNPLTSCHIIATSRPCKQALVLLRSVEIRYQICDLSETQRNDMLRSRLSAREVAEFNRQLLTKPQLLPMMGNPLQASLIISMFKGRRSHAQSLPSGLCDVYGDVVTRVLQRYVTRKLRLVDPALSDPVEKAVKHQSLRECAVSTVEVILEDVEHLALRGLASQQYLFDVPEVPEGALESGLLVHWSIADEYKTRRLGKSCQFIHLAIQEFLGARCVARQGNLVEEIDECMEIVGIDVRRYNFWLCLTGMLDRKHLKHLLCKMTSIVSSGTYEQQKMAARLVLHSMAQVLAQKQEKVLSCWRVRDLSLPAVCFDLKFADIFPDGRLDLGHHQLSNGDFSILCSQLEVDNTVKSLNLESCQLDEGRCQQLATCSGLKKLRSFQIGINKCITGPGLRCLLQPFSQRLYHLSSLTIRSCNLEDSDMPAIHDLVKASKTLDELCLYRAMPVLSSESCWLLAKAVEVNKSLTRLGCYAMHIDDAGACSLAQAAVVQGKIDRLIFRDNDISDVGGLACLQSAASLGCHRLDLSFNRLTKDVLKEIFVTVRVWQALPRPSSTSALSDFELKLAGNDFTRQIVQMLMAAFTSSAVSVDFGFASISADGIVDLSPARLTKQHILHHGKYTQLNLSFLGMGDCYMARFQDYLAELKEVESVSCGRNNLTAAGMVPLAAALKVNVCIQALDLSSCNVGVQGLETLLDVIDEDGENSTLRYLSLQGNPLTTSTSTNEEWERVEVAIGRLVSECPHLELVGLSNTGIGDRGAAVVAEYLPRQSSLLWLALGANNITEDGVQSLCGALAKDSTLRILDFSTNQLGDHAIALLNSMQKERICSGSNHIDMIFVDNNPFSGEAILGPGLLNGRFYFPYSTAILSLLDDFKSGT